MMPVATRPDQRHATNSNAASALTETAAGIRTGRVLVKADRGRLGTSSRFKDCRSAPKFQALSRDGAVNFRRMPVGPVRSLNGERT